VSRTTVCSSGLHHFLNMASERSCRPFWICIPVIQYLLEQRIPIQSQPFTQLMKGCLKRTIRTERFSTTSTLRHGGAHRQRRYQRRPTAAINPNVTARD
jgi:hypothetical protein